MEKTRFFRPYRKNGRQTLQKTGPGVYIIRLEGKTAYVGMSAKDVKKTMYRHFQQWTDIRPERMKVYSAHERVTFAGMDMEKFLCRVIFCKAEKAAKLETALILKHTPEYNRLKLEYLTKAQREKIQEEYKAAEFVPMDEETYFYSTPKTNTNDETPF